MSEAERAVGSRSASVVVLSELRRVDSRVDALNAKVDREILGLHGKMDDVLNRLGKPSDGDGQPASGVFAHLNAHNDRIGKFERLWERGLGFGMAVVGIAGPLVGALWWLAGDRITALLQG